MDYRINEGSLRIPAQAQDRSVNMLILNHGPGGLTLVVTRDRLQEGEDLDGFLTRQMRTLASQVKQFRQQPAEAVTVGPAQLAGRRTATSFKQNNATVHQLQTAILLDAAAVLVLTLTCAAPLNGEQLAYAQQLLDSFTPAIPEAAPLDAPTTPAA
jgi:hypothetical protein